MESTIWYSLDLDCTILMYLIQLNYQLLDLNPSRHKLSYLIYNI